MLKSNFLKKLGLCVLSAALCTSAFAACGKDGDGDGDNGKKIDENTNISDVTSEKVADETAWKAAFDVTKFTNFSMKTVSKQTVAAKTLQNALTFLYTGDKAYYSVTGTDENGKTQRNDVYLAKANGDFSVYGMNYVNGEKTFEGAYDKNNSGEYNYMMTGETGTMMLTQLGEVPFAEVSYSEEKKGYIYSKDGAEAVLKIADGLFAGYAMSGKSGEGESKMSMEMSAIYYNIGTTSITLPEKMTMPAAEETMTKADFYAEVKKREDASIAAKKWGTVNVSGTQTKNGVTANVYANNAPISHGMGFSMVKLTVSESETSVSSTNVGVFGYSVMQNNTMNFSTEEFKKVGANLQAVWVATEGGETASMKVTLNADGYLTEYEMKSETATETVEQKLTFSGYAGEYTSGKKPGGDSDKKPGGSDTPADKEITVSDFVKQIAQLQEKAGAYTKVSVYTLEGDYLNLDITDGEVVCGEGENALHLPVGVKKIEEMIKSMQMLQAKTSIWVRSAGNSEVYDLTFMFSNNTIITYTFGSDGYLREYKKSVGNEVTMGAKLHYQK